MSDKAGNNLLILFSIKCFAAVIFSLFLFDNSSQFEFLNELIGKNIRLVILCLIALTFAFFGIKGKMISRKNNPSSLLRHRKNHESSPKL